MALRVLVCDDEAGLREMLCILLRRHGYAVEAVSGVREARSALGGAVEPFDAVVTDLVMPDGSGLEVLEAARRRDPDTQVIVVTAYATTERAVAAMRAGAYDYVQKPFENQALLATLEKALERRALESENRTLREALERRWQEGDLIGRSAAMDRVRELVRRVADSPVNVLITGESGTGKELVARALHHRSGRSSEPFVAINCGALPEPLMESELFGHERGAFTGADRSKAGLVRTAAGGTLFLDEVGELPPALQVKLLRVIQERKVRPVGGTVEYDVDVRIVAATNRDLEAEVAEGRFRRDLFYRLNVVRIHLPPLRERLEDVPLLAEHFLRKHGALQGKRVTFSAEALAWLGGRSYPGNVRELENLVERAVALCRGERITLEELSAEPGVGGVAAALPLPEEGFHLDEWLQRIEREMLLQALKRAGGVRTRAARLLGLSFRSFRYRLAKYGLGEEPSREEPVATGTPPRGSEGGA